MHNHHHATQKAFSGPGVLADRKEVDAVDFESEVRCMADRIATRHPRTWVRNQSVEKFDTTLGCWIKVPAPAKATSRDTVIKDYLLLSNHPRFGEMVREAKEAHGGYIEDDEVFLDVVRAEYVWLKSLILREKWSRS